MTPITSSKQIRVRGKDIRILEAYALIQKPDRAGNDGKNIKCPHCGCIVRINNLRWKKKECKSCRTTITKYEWLIDQLDTWRTPR